MFEELKEDESQAVWRISEGVDGNVSNVVLNPSTKTSAKSRFFAETIIDPEYGVVTVTGYVGE